MYKITISDKVYQVDKNEIDGEEMIVDFIEIEERFFHLIHQHQSYSIELLSFDKEAKTYKIKVNNQVYEASVKDKFDLLMAQMGFDGVAQNKLKELKAPMPGLVIDVRVSVGEQIKKGDALLVLEAMKMENVLKASSDVVIKSIEIEKGNSVEKNQVLLIFE